MDKIEANGILKTVLASELEFQTKNGWKVVGSYQDSIPVAYGELMDAPQGYYSSNPYYVDIKGMSQNAPPGKAVSMKSLALPTTFFVLQKDEESVVAELTAAVAKAEQQRDAAMAALKTTGEEKNKTKALLDEALARKEAVQANYTNEVEARRREEGLRRKLEGDLAVLKKAIGDLRYNEIVGASQAKG